MKTRALIIGLCIVSLIAQTANADEGAPSTFAFEDFLTRAAVKLDIYFTLETNMHSDVFGDLVKNEDPPDNVDDLIKMLHKMIPDFTVTRSKSNPAVLQIIETSLTKGRGNGLDANVSLSVDGTLKDLISAIHGMDPRIVREAGSFPMMFAEDETTHVVVHATRESVRDVLTNSLPLSKYNRCLWTSMFIGDAQHVKTDISFYGPFDDMSGLAAAPAPPYAIPNEMPFSSGVLAYCINKESEAHEKIAISFIEEQMGKGQPLQVRWAMLYLGKYKVEKGIPILLKYLDYRYTTCTLVNEEFPALNALTMIGKPAVGAALSSAATERNDLRLSLLFRVVSEVEGKTPGVADWDMMSSKIADAQQRAKVEAAIKPVLQSENASTQPAK